MILRSGKLVIKRPKCDGIKEDFINKLHDDLLTRIVSLLPEADANRTRILSKQWKNLWALLPNLHFVTPSHCSIEEANKFLNFVAQTLSVRGGMPIQRFLLCCSKHFPCYLVYECFRQVIIQCKVQELEIRTSDMFWFRSDLCMTYSSLISFTLRGKFYIEKPDGELLFPRLKKIVLEGDYPLYNKGIENLISRCPVLEELVVDSKLVGPIIDTDTFTLSSPSLKRIRLSYVIMVYNVVVDAPKLEYFEVSDTRPEYFDVFNVWPTSFSETTSLSLMEARINTRHESVGQLVTCLSNVKILTLTGSTLSSLMDDLDRGLARVPVFPNLVKFVVKINFHWGWIILPLLFDRMPKLEHITFADGLLPFPRAQHTLPMIWEPRDWEDDDVPACLHFKMKEIVIENQETITTEEFDLIKYLLEHSNHLETLTLNAHEIDEETREQILNFHRGSESCRIQLV